MESPGVPGSGSRATRGDGIWQYQNFIHGRHLQDKKLQLQTATRAARWLESGRGYFVNRFGYDSALYAPYRLGPDTAARFTGQPTITMANTSVQIGTPQWKHFSGSGYFLQGQMRTSSSGPLGRFMLLSADLSYRPTERLRNSFSYFWQQ